MTGPTIVVNGKETVVGVGTTIGSLLTGLGRRPDGVAAAVNDELVVRADWPTFVLREGDRLELLSAVQGG